MHYEIINCSSFCLVSSCFEFILYLFLRFLMVLPVPGKVREHWSTRVWNRALWYSNYFFWFLRVFLFLPESVKLRINFIALRVVVYSSWGDLGRTRQGGPYMPSGWGSVRAKEFILLQWAEERTMHSHRHGMCWHSARVNRCTYYSSVG